MRDSFVISLVTILFAVGLMTINASDVFPDINLKKVQSTVDGKQYKVRGDVKDPQKAADTLAEIKKRLHSLSVELPEKTALTEKLKSIEMTENPTKFPDSKLTSYTVNKGDRMVLCLRDPKTQKVQDIDILMYVAIHEAAHIVCPEIGHTQLFKDIFKKLLKKGVSKNIIVRTNYKVKPMSYCGIILTESLI